MTTDNRSRIISGEMVDGGGRVKHFNVGPYRCVRLSCSTFLIFWTTSMFNIILCTKLLGTVPSFTIKCIYSLKLLKNRQPALHNSMVLESSLNNLPPTFHLLRNSVNTKSTLFENTRRSPQSSYPKDQLTAVGLPKHSELTFLYLSTYKYVRHSEKI